MRQTGRLVQWDDAKGFGFIQPDGAGPSDKIFVHARSFGLRAFRPFVGERLSFEAGLDAQGKRRARAVKSLTPRPASPHARAKTKPTPSHQASSKASKPQGSLVLWLIPVFATLVGAVHLVWPLPHGLWGVYMAMSMASFIVYALDKRAAQRQQWRVAEGTLHLLALACGWPGALLAQQLLAHKRSKPAFLRVFWLTVALNILAFILIFTPALSLAWVRFFPR